MDARMRVRVRPDEACPHALEVPDKLLDADWAKDALRHHLVHLPPGDLREREREMSHRRITVVPLRAGFRRELIRPPALRPSPRLRRREPQCRLERPDTRLSRDRGDAGPLPW